MADPMAKLQQAEALLAGQREGLEAALEVWSRENSAYARQQHRNVWTRLVDVKRHQADMARAPDFFAPLVLGFQGPNGWGPYIEALIREAEQEDIREAAE